MQAQAYQIRELFTFEYYINCYFNEENILSYNINNYSARSCLY